MPVLRHLQPVSLELKKCSNKYPQLFFKVRIFETSRLVYAGTAQQVFETGGGLFLLNYFLLNYFLFHLFLFFPKKCGGGGR